MSLVFVKSPGQNVETNVELSSLLPPGRTIAAASILAVTPTTSPVITATINSVSPSEVAVQVAGGVEGVSYGVRLSVELDSGQDLEFTLAVLVKTDLNVPHAASAPLAMQSLVGEMQAGNAAIGKVSFLLPQEEDPSGSYILWELVSPVGEVVAAGNCYELEVVESQFSTSVAGEAVIHVPSSAAPSAFNEKYQLRWTLCRPGQPDVFSYEGLAVLGLSTEPHGVQDMVELLGDVAAASITVSELYENVTVEVFAPVGNARLFGPVAASAPKRVGSGWYYQVNINTAQLQPAVTPYIVSWKYFHSATPGNSYRETARMFVLNASMMNAVEDVRQVVNKARTTLFQFADMIFDTQTLISFLRRGMDMFNGAGGVWTSFDMTDATGGIRDFWLGYAEVAMLQAQSLAEGEKAFDFQGQAIQLSVDRTQYYDKLAADTLSRLESNVRPFKQNLQNKGVTGGTGNVNTLRGNQAYLGISIHPISQFGRHWNWSRIQ